MNQKVNCEIKILEKGEEVYAVGDGKIEKTDKFFLKKYLRKN